MGADFMASLEPWAAASPATSFPFSSFSTIVVFFHELGHFLIGRWCGVKVPAFSIGFGPEIVGFNDRYGTRWKLSAIPLGGFVKFFGDDNAASVPDHDAAAQMSQEERKVSFVHQPVRKRAAVVVAGTDRKFHSRHRDLCRDLRRPSAGNTPARASTPSSRAAPQQTAGFKAGRSRHLDRRPEDRHVSPTCSGSSASARASR